LKVHYGTVSSLADTVEGPRTHVAAGPDFT
jgi:hypothetical protein